VVRHGHLPQREIMTGIGSVAVRQPRVRDREATKGERIRYSPSILPRYARRSNSLEVTDPYPLPEGHLNRRLRGSAGGPRRQGRARSFGIDHRPPQGDVDRGACALAEARSVSKALRLLLGRRHTFGGPARGTGAVHPGDHRRDA
jgi:hypothetical protein